MTGQTLFILLVFFVIICRFFDTAIFGIKLLSGKDIVHHAGKIRYNFTSPSFKQQCEIVLLNRFPFYNKLSEAEKQFFLKRIIIFIKNKKMVPCEMEEVTLEMRVLISATAIQLTFGLDDSVLSHVKGFRIYLDIYYSRLMNTRFKGHYAPNGVISLAYNHFLKGLDETDGINLGLHEMAHALHLSHFNKIHAKLLFTDVIAAWFQKVRTMNQNELHPMEHSLFREYSNTNDKEFFAVAVENFFERPEQFYEAMPKLFKCLCLLLNQYPITIKNEVKQIVNSTNQSNPLFSKRTNYFKMAGYIPIVGFFLFIYSEGQEFPAVVFLIIVTIIFILALPEIAKVDFYEDYVLIRRLMGRNRKQYLDINSIVYIAYIDNDLDHDSRCTLSILFEENEAKNAMIYCVPSKQFVYRLQDYCSKNDLLFIDKEN